MGKYFTYIIFSETKNLHYIGSTSNLDDRLNRHNTNRNKFTRNKGPWVVTAIKEFNSKSEAYKMEMKLKSFKNPKYAIEYLNNL